MARRDFTNMIGGATVEVGLDRRDVTLVVVHVAVRRLRAGTIASHI
jgi:hypothetical protein